MKTLKQIEKIKSMRDKKMSFGDIAKELGTSRQNVHRLLNTPRRYTMKEFWDSLYWELNDCDGDFDGFIHIVSTIDGSEIKIKLKKLLGEDRYNNLIQK